MAKSSAVTGVPELKRKLAALRGKVAQGAADGLVESAQAIRTGARRLVPVDSGKLRDGVVIRYRNQGKTAEIGIVDDDVYYGQFIEFGTSSIHAQPFLAPAAEAERRRVPDRVKTAVVKRIK
ncbi:MAG: HK97-gp10 family putative phage morphogenesis protein [Pseudonocardiaceae bacterium]